MSSSDSESRSPDDNADVTQGSISAKKRKLWTRQEDERLRLLVSYWGDQGGRRSNWDKIATNFEDRTAKNCRKRWFHSLDPKLRRGKWNKNEDRILKEAYDQLGPVWQRISQLIPGRTDDQCAKRYNDVLNPAIQDRLRPWTQEEDDLLQQLFKEMGPKWQLISTKMTARTGLTIRNRFRKLTRPSKKPIDSTLNQGDLGPLISDNDVTQSREHGSNNDGSNLIGPSIAYNVPGSNANQGFPAGADANWLLGGNQNPQLMSSNGNNNILGQENLNDAGRQSLYGLTNPFLGSQQRQLTLTVEDPKNPALNFLQQTHHPISEAQLNQIIDYATKSRQQIIVHQHIYQNAEPVVQAHNSAGPVKLSNQDQQVVVGTRMDTYQPYQDSQLLKIVHPPVQPPETNVSSLQMPMMMPMNPAMNHAVSGDLSPSNEVAKADYIERKSYTHPSEMASHLTTQLEGLSDLYSSHSRTATQPPPDEYLSRPLVFEDSQANASRFDTDEIDFLAFNPS